jgi:hypothetical protein
VISSVQGKRGGKVLVYELEDTTKVKEYEKLGMTERRYENVDAFVENYLKGVSSVYNKIFDEVGNKV